MSADDNLLDTPEKYLILPHLMNIHLNLFLKQFFQMLKSYMQLCPIQGGNICKRLQEIYAKDDKKKTVYIGLISQLNHFLGKRYGCHDRI